MQPDQLIRELIATGTMNDETLADLERMRAEHAAGTLDADDAAYLEALHAKVTGAPLQEPAEDVPAATLDDLTLAQWRDRALRAEAQLAELRALTDARQDRPAD